MKKLIAFLGLSCSIAFAAVLGTGVGGSDVITREYDFVGVEKIHIENNSGKIMVSEMERPKIVITGTKTKAGEKCTVTTERTDFSEILVRVERPIGEECQVDLDLKVPKQITLSIWSGSGDVDVRGIEGNLSFNVGSGAVKADGRFTKLTGKSGSGAVVINGVAGGGSVNVGSGAVEMKFLENPKGNLDVKTGSGNALLQFPKESKVNAKLETGSGSVSNDIGTYESAEYGVSVKTGSGNLKVKAY